MSKLLLPFIAALILLNPPVQAHEYTPGYLSLTEITPTQYKMQWKVETVGGLNQLLFPRLSDQCTPDQETRLNVITDAELHYSTINCPENIEGLDIWIEGLSESKTDVLLRVDYLNGGSFLQRLTPTDDRVTLTGPQTAWSVVATYSALGIEHILGGIDHLLFVLALLLLIRKVIPLVKTITAFTLAHSITLVATTLGWVSLASAPVETVIAISILFLALQLAKQPIGRPLTEGEDLASRFPWLVAFSFGLLHGFGFAGALSEIGLPEHSIPLALLFFNVGVEIGQLLFIGAVLATGWLITKVRIPTPLWWRHAVAYGIGSLSVFWIIERSTWLI